MEVEGEGLVDQVAIGFPGLFVPEVVAKVLLLTGYLI
jgi:hypothetical protein